MQTASLKVQKYSPLVISGCSGVGKGTLINSLLTTFPELFQLSVSYTTRQPRPVETDGKDYNFVSKATFQKLVKEDDFLEYCYVHGQYYGTNAAHVQQIINKGKICLLDVDIQGAEKIQTKHPNWNFVFIEPPSIEDLRLRIEKRGMNTAEDTKRRLANAEKQLKRLKEVGFYKVIVNGKLEVCYKEFVNYINSVYHLLIEIQQ